MKGYYCPRVKVECPNGTSLDDPYLCNSLRIAHEDGVSIKVLAEVLKRHTCTIRFAIISAGGSVQHGRPYSRRKS